MKMAKHISNEHRIAMLLEEFSAPECNTLDAQRLVSDIGGILGEQIARAEDRIDALCPILRAGLPLAVGISRHLSGLDVAPIHAKRLSGRERVAIEQVGKIRSNSTLLLTDTVAATGKTLTTVAALLHSEWQDLRLLVAVAYASPEAISAVEACDLISGLWIGQVAQGVDSNGYLFPATNGDAGDKMYLEMF